MKGIKFIGNPQDHTGYGRASLNTILAILSAKIPIMVENRSFVAREARIPLPNELVSLIKPQIPYSHVIVQLTPEFFSRAKETGKTNIGYFFWETDKLPVSWTRACNTMDEIWVPCESNRLACLNSGVVVPIRIVPQAMSLHTHTRKILIPKVDKQTYIFYSIFQWTERKNPKCMLQAYWSAFTKNDNVMLVLKAYGADDSPSSINLIKNTIGRYKAEIAEGKSLHDLPPVYLLPKIISDDDIACLHNTGHCLVSTARGEGWNMSAATAILMNKPIISSVYGGVVDFFDQTEYYAVNSNGMIPVSGMPWIKWYTSDQHWDDPNCASVARLMREVFNEQTKIVQYRDIGMDIASVGQLIGRLIGVHQ
jgi:hypothetical protein